VLSPRSTAGNCSLDPKVQNPRGDRGSRTDQVPSASLTSATFRQPCAAQCSTIARSISTVLSQASPLSKVRFHSAMVFRCLLTRRLYSAQSRAGSCEEGTTTIQYRIKGVGLAPGQTSRLDPGWAGRAECESPGQRISKPVDGLSLRLDKLSASSPWNRESP
jgi:hypothetical protein